jgi:lauroyl/myristoyl acyltransferase
VARYRKNVVFENLKKSFPEKSEKEIRRQLRKRFYRHFSELTLEIIKLGNMDEAILKKGGCKKHRFACMGISNRKEACSPYHAFQQLGMEQLPCPLPET